MGGPTRTLNTAPTSDNARNRRPMLLPLAPGTVVVFFQDPASASTLPGLDRSPSLERYLSSPAASSDKPKLSGIGRLGKLGKILGNFNLCQEPGFLELN